MELEKNEAERILRAHAIEVDFGDPRTSEEIATQLMFFGTISLTEFIENKDEIRGILWQGANT